MNALSHFGSKPRMLIVVTTGLVAVHAILIYALQHSGVPLAVVSGLALLVIVKHFGLLGALYGLSGGDFEYERPETPKVRTAAVNAQRMSKFSHDHDTAP